MEKKILNKIGRIYKEMNFIWNTRESNKVIWKWSEYKENKNRFFEYKGNQEIKYVKSFRDTRNLLEFLIFIMKRSSFFIRALAKVWEKQLQIRES